MRTLTQSMALFWTLVEGTILVCLRWGYLRLGGRASNQKWFIPSCGILFALLILLVLGGQGLVQGFRDMPATDLSLYRRALWGFLCTLWVFLEGWIMLLVIRIYRLLSSGFTGKPAEREWVAPSILGLALFALFAWYTSAFIGTALKYGMDPGAIHRVGAFYVRICGVFWIAFEWVVAIYGLKTYSLLRKVAGLQVAS
ncbi:MAG: hypothetical protein AB1512_18805 [Thermodesulfobacteriota bacterium]